MNIGNYIRRCHSKRWSSSVDGCNQNVQSSVRRRDSAVSKYESDRRRSALLVRMFSTNIHILFDRDNYSKPNRSSARRVKRSRALTHLYMNSKSLSFACREERTDSESRWHRRRVPVEPHDCRCTLRFLRVPCLRRCRNGGDISRRIEIWK